MKKQNVPDCRNSSESQ